MPLPPSPPRLVCHLPGREAPSVDIVSSMSLTSVLSSVCRYHRQCLQHGSIIPRVVHRVSNNSCLIISSVIELSLMHVCGKIVSPEKLRVLERWGGGGGGGGGIRVRVFTYIKLLHQSNEEAVCGWSKEYWQLCTRCVPRGTESATVVSVFSEHLILGLTDHR